MGNLMLRHKENKVRLFIVILHNLMYLKNINKNIQTIINKHPCFIKRR